MIIFVEVSGLGAFLISQDAAFLHNFIIAPEAPLLCGLSTSRRSLRQWTANTRGAFLVMKANKRKRKTPANRKSKGWTLHELHRLSNLIDIIRAQRFGYPYRGR